MVLDERKRTNHFFFLILGWTFTMTLANVDYLRKPKHRPFQTREQSEEEFLELEESQDWGEDTFSVPYCTLFQSALVAHQRGEEDEGLLCTRQHGCHAQEDELAEIRLECQKLVGHMDLVGSLLSGKSCTEMCVSYNILYCTGCDVL
mmetsp:Transcript_28471/g.43779  ORF Transcript_28471/g.43779 Transcript_28471/m.43779 type:complete len:147 (+) Transcript_28471:95-535(+)